MIELRHNTATREEGPGSLSPVRTPGQHLQDGRARAGLEIADVAQQLRISENYVRALESDRYEALPTEPFILGYLKTYARLLGMQPQPLIDCYRDYRRQLAGTVEPVVTIEEEEPWTRRLRQHLVLIVVLGAALLLLLGYWLLGGNNEQAEDTAVPSASGSAAVIAAQGASVPSVPAAPLAAAEGDEEKLAALSSAPESVPGAMRPAPSQPEPVTAEVAAGQSSEPQVQPVTGLDELVIRFDDECWLEVIDANGDVLATDLYQGDQRLQLLGVAPFRVVLGNASAVQVSLNGSAVQLGSPDSRNRLRTSIGERANP